MYKRVYGCLECIEKVLVCLQSVANAATEAKPKVPATFLIFDEPLRLFFSMFSILLISVIYNITDIELNVSWSFKNVFYCLDTLENVGSKLGSRLELFL